MYDGILESKAVLQKMRALRGHIKKSREAAAKAQSPAEVAEALAAFDKKAAALDGGAGSASGPGGMGGQTGTGGPRAAGAPDSLSSISGSLNSLMNMLQEADAAPTSQLIAAVTERRQALRALLDKWESLRTRELAALNSVLKAANLPEIAIIQD
jgi:hypothetical protein